MAQKLRVVIESQQSAHREMQKMMNQKDKTSEENERQKS
jgi:Sec-independent protein translocase protein TatA